jgi:hypothetical protein
LLTSRFHGLSRPAGKRTRLLAAGSDENLEARNAVCSVAVQPKKVAAMSVKHAGRDPAIWVALRCDELAAGLDLKGRKKGRCVRRAAARFGFVPPGDALAATAAASLPASPGSALPVAFAIGGCIRAFALHCIAVPSGAAAGRRPRTVRAAAHQHGAR